MKSLQIHIFIGHQSHSKGPLPHQRNISPETQVIISQPPAAPNSAKNPFPSFNVQHQAPNLALNNPSTNIINLSSRNATPPTTINDQTHRPPSGGGASSSNSSIASEAEQIITCDLCGLSGIPNRQAYKQVRLEWQNKWL